MTTDAVGGVWTYCVDLANGLAARGVETVLAVVGPDASPAQTATVSGTSVINTGLPLDWLATSAAEIASTGRALAALSREIQADIVHLSTPAFAANGDFRVPVLGACHSCMSTWWAAVKNGPMPEDFLWRHAVQAKGLARCDTLLAPSQAFANAVFRAYGKRPGVALNGRRSPELDGESRDEIAAFAFTAGRLWDDGKNLRILDKAAGLSSLRVKAAGPVEGPGGAVVRTQHVDLMGSLSAEQVRAQLQRRPIFVSTALYEPFGLAVLEAAQAGCPLVLSDIPTFRELWSDAAVFVNPNDADHVAVALRRLSENRRKAAALGVAARSRASRYTVNAMTEATLRAYRAAVGASAEALA